jgi:hypothetical protein
VNFYPKEEEKLRILKRKNIIDENESHTSVVMPCDNSVSNEQRNVFSTEGPYR